MEFSWVVGWRQTFFQSEDNFSLYWQAWFSLLFRLTWQYQLTKFIIIILTTIIIIVIQQTNNMLYCHCQSTWQPSAALSFTKFQHVDIVRQARPAILLEVFTACLMFIFLLKTLKFNFALHLSADQSSDNARDFCTSHLTRTSSGNWNVVTPDQHFSAGQICQYCSSSETSGGGVPGQLCQDTAWLHGRKTEGMAGVPIFNQISISGFSMGQR